MLYTLKNDVLTVLVESFGAELKSLVSNATGTEYMWCADEKYWKRTSPVLFPSVGTMKNKEYLYNGKKYPMPQHGFARDMEFDMVSHTEDTIWMEVNASPKTLAVYPFHFTLQIGYELKGSQVKVLWKVINHEEENTMYFSIGAHPAFNCPIHGEENWEGYGMHLNTETNVLYSLIDENALMLNSKNELKLEHGTVLFDPKFFDRGAYIIEDYEASEVSLVDAGGKEYLSVSFSAPLFGIWSPEGKHAPFVCIEPWYGRCDRTTFEGRLDEREWGNKLTPHGVFEKNYTITIK